MDQSKPRLNCNQVNRGQPIPVQPWFSTEWRCKAVDPTPVACLESGKTGLDRTYKHYQNLSDFLVTILCYHRLLHQLPGPFVTWTNPNQVCTLHTRHMPMSKLGFGNKERVSNNCITDTTRYRSQSTGLVIHTSKKLVKHTAVGCRASAVVQEQLGCMSDGKGA